MTQRYIEAMQFSNLHAYDILQKHQRNRPLGDLMVKQKFFPQEPSLTTETVDIDLPRKHPIPYRTKSAMEILQDEERKVHSVYKRARSAVLGHSKNRVRSGKTPRTRDMSSTLSSTVRINGSAGSLKKPRPGSGVNSSCNYAHSTPATPRPRSPQKSAMSRSDSIADSVAISKYNMDPSMLESSHSYNATHQKIQNRKNPEYHDWSDGLFKRGSKDRAKQNASPATHWLIFGGGQTERSRGIVDAFATMDKADDFYTIESVTGSKVAQQLKRGDSIRIGKNGKVQQTDLKVRREDYSTKNNTEKLEDLVYMPEEIDVSEYMFVESEKEPVSWEDQVSRPDAKVLEPTTPRPPDKTPNLCENNPVTFRKLLDDEPRPKITQKKTGKRYRVIQRPKSRKGHDNMDRVSGRITVLTLNSGDDSGGESDADSEAAYAEILRSQTAMSQRISELSRANTPAVNKPSPTKVPIVDETQTASVKVETVSKITPHDNSCTMCDHEDHKRASSSPKELSVQRPHTATTFFRPDSDLKVVQPKSRSIKTRTVRSAGSKPTPVTNGRLFSSQSGHKLDIKTPASITKGTTPQGNLGYIKFTQHIVAPPETILERPQSGVSSRTHGTHQSLHESLLSKKQDKNFNSRYNASTPAPDNTPMLGSPMSSRPLTPNMYARYTADYIGDNGGPPGSGGSYQGPEGDRNSSLYGDDQNSGGSSPRGSIGNADDFDDDIEEDGYINNANNDDNYDDIHNDAKNDDDNNDAKKDNQRNVHFENSVIFNDEDHDKTIDQSNKSEDIDAIIKVEVNSNDQVGDEIEK